MTEIPSVKEYAKQDATSLSKKKFPIVVTMFIRQSKTTIDKDTKNKPTMMIKKTHQVLDLHYHPSEGQGCFDGTRQECEDFAATQTPHFMYRVVPMTEEEIKNHPDNR